MSTKSAVIHFAGEQNTTDDFVQTTELTVKVESKIDAYMGTPRGDVNIQLFSKGYETPQRPTSATINDDNTVTITFGGGIAG